MSWKYKGRVLAMSREGCMHVEMYETYDHFFSPLHLSMGRTESAALNADHKEKLLRESAMR